MPRKDLISSLFWIGSGGLIILGSLRLHLGTPQNPGPGFLPLLVGVLLLILSTALLIRSLGGESEKVPARTPGAANHFKLIGTVVALFFFAFAFPHLGLLLTAIPLMIFLPRAIGELSWRASLLIGILTSSGMYILFKLWLGVQFPAGPWGF